VQSNSSKGGSELIESLDGTWLFRSFLLAGSPLLQGIKILLGDRVITLNLDIPPGISSLINRALPWVANETHVF
jgi:hypothetical protein